MFRIITLKKNFFSVRSSPDPPNCSPIQSWSGQNWRHSWSVLISGRWSIFCNDEDF